MTRLMRRTIGTAALLLGLGLLAGPQFALAADDEVPKDVKEAILKIADLIDKGKMDDAKKEAEDLVKKKKYDPLTVGKFKDPMHALSLRTKGGLGVGSKPGEFKPDGVEAQIMSLGKKALTATALKKDADELKKMAEITVAVADITAAATPKKDDGKKKVKNWEKWTKEMRDAALELKAAAEKKDSKAILNAAKNLDGSCTSCHQDFRPAS